MSKVISRRKALATGAAGMLMVTACSRKEQQNAAEVSQKQPTHPPFLSPWSPSADLERDLTPGETPIRLASWSTEARFDYKRDKSITDRVKKIRGMGYTSACSVCSSEVRNPWLDAPESDVRELKEALNKYDVTYFDVHTYTNNIHPDLEQRKKNHKYIIEQCEVAE